MEAER
jgi:hypothetical protein